MTLTGKSTGGVRVLLTGEASIISYLKFYPLISFPEISTPFSGWHLDLEQFDYDDTRFDGTMGSILDFGYCYELSLSLSYKETFQKYVKSGIAKFYFQYIDPFHPKGKNVIVNLNIKHPAAIIQSKTGELYFLDSNRTNAEQGKDVLADLIYIATGFERDKERTVDPEYRNFLTIWDEILDDFDNKEYSVALDKAHKMDKFYPNNEKVQNLLSVLSYFQKKIFVETKDDNLNSIISGAVALKTRKWSQFSAPLRRKLFDATNNTDLNVKIKAYLLAHADEIGLNDNEKDEYFDQILQHNLITKRHFLSLRGKKKKRNRILAGLVDSYNEILTTQYGRTIQPNQTEEKSAETRTMYYNNMLYCGYDDDKKEPVYKGCSDSNNYYDYLSTELLYNKGMDTVKKALRKLEDFFREEGEGPLGFDKQFNIILKRNNLVENIGAKKGGFFDNVARDLERMSGLAGFDCFVFTRTGVLFIANIGKPIKNENIEDRVKFSEYENLNLGANSIELLEEEYQNANLITLLHNLRIAFIRDDQDELEDLVSEMEKILRHQIYKDHGRNYICP